MKTVTIVLLPVLILVSCQSGQKQHETVSSTAVKVVEDIPVSEENTKYKLPSPIELYLLIKKADAQFNKNALHNIEKSKDYLRSDSKSINFGIYASDLAYCTVYGKHQTTYTLFKTIKSMAQELGLSEGYDEEIVQRLEENLYDTDSLYHITNESYWEACKYLEETNRTNMLSRILLGAWLESVYLAINSISIFDPRDEIIVRITEQSYLLENLIGYISGLRSDTEIEQHLKQLIDIQYSFDKLYDNPEGTIITLSQYNEITDKITSYRTKLIQ